MKKTSTKTATKKATEQKTTITLGEASEEQLKALAFDLTLEIQNIQSKYNKVVQELASRQK
jgi:hypothetical protein